jgi:CRP-like cAMP-binding protein
MPAFSPLSDPEAVMGILSRISILGGVPGGLVSRILRHLEEARIPKGAAVFRRGDEPTHIYIVKSGSFALVITDGDVEVEKTHLRAGDCFGEASLMAMHRHSATALALEDSEIMVLSRRALMNLRHGDVELFALLMMNIARELARRLTLTDGILLHYLHEHSGHGTITAPGAI